MSEVLGLIGQIAFIACLQIVFDIVVEQNPKSQLGKLLSVACYAGALLLILRFIFDNLMSEIQRMFNIMF